MFRLGYRRCSRRRAWRALSGGEEPAGDVRAELRRENEKNSVALLQIFCVPPVPPTVGMIAGAITLANAVLCRITYLHLHLW